MLVYATPSHPTYSPPAHYPLPRLVPARAPTARERYLRALADAESARERYVSELEEQRVLDGTWRQEVLHQADYRMRQSFTSPDVIARRRTGRACRSSGCQPVFVKPDYRQQAFPTQQSARHTAVREQLGPLKGLESLFEALPHGTEADEDHARLKVQQKPEEHRARQHAFARRQRGHAAPVQDQEAPLKSIEELFEALPGNKEEDEKSKEQHRLEEAHVQQARKAALHSARVRFINELDTIREEAQAARSARTTRPASSLADPSQVPTHPTSPATRVETHAYPSAVRHSDFSSTCTRAARTIQRRWRSHSADTAARKEALSVIEALRARFQFLRDTFSFPEHLEFREGQEHEVPALLYSPSNAAVHGYTHELTKLLMCADAVLSGGSSRVREERRTFVRAVEAELESVEARVAKIWGKKLKGTAVNVPQAVQSRTAAADTQETANGVEERTSNSEPAETPALTTCSGLPTSPSTITVPVTGTHAAPHPQDISSLAEHPQHSTNSDTPHTQANGVIVPKSDEGSILGEEITVIEQSLEAETEAINVADSPGRESNSELLTADGVAGSVAPSPRPPSPESTLNEPSEPHSESESMLSDSSHVNNSSARSSRTIDLVGPTAPSGPAPNSTLGAEAFDVVYPDSPSSTASGLQVNVDTPHDPQTLGEDEIESEKHILDPGDETKGDSEEDGFELL